MRLDTPCEAQVNRKNSHETTSEKLRRHILILSLVAGVFVVPILSMWLLNVFCGTPIYVLPDLEEIASVYAHFIQDRVTEKQLEFEVPKENWAQIFSCLTPSKPDRSPSKWQVLGSMRIQTSDGREVQIWLYDTFKGQGAFSVGPSLERRSYYRGGDSACLQNALRTAYTSWERGNGTSTKVK